MNWFSWLWPNSKPARSAELADGGMGGIRGAQFITRAPRGLAPGDADGLSISTVYACVRLFREQIGQLPLHVYERLENGRKRLAIEHGLQKTLRRPNAWQTAFEFKEFMMVCLLLRGNFYAKVLPGANGSATILEPLHPDRVKPVRLEDGSLAYDVRNVKGGTDRYLQGEIWHVKGLSLDGVIGVSVITYAANAMHVARSTETYAGAFFDNNAAPGIVLQGDNPITLKSAEETRDAWNRSHRGPGNAHKIAVIPHGLKADTIALSQQDSQYIETRKYTSADICRFFGAPPHMVGDLDRSTNNNIEHQSREFLMYSLLPWAVRIEQSGDRDLIADEERFYLKFNVEGFLRADLKTRSEAYAKMIACAMMTPNEGRELEDSDPLPGGDVLLIQGAMAPLDRIVNPPKPEPPPEPNPPAPAKEEADDEEEDEMSSRVVAEAKALIETTVAGMLAIEADMARRAVKKPNFLAAVDDLKAKQAERMLRAVAPAARVAAAALGRQVDAAAAVAAYVDRSHADLLGAAEVLPEQLAAAVESLLSAWQSRPAEFVRQIFEGA